MQTLDARTLAFYRQAIDVLGDAGIPFLVGGGYALPHYTGIERHTKDLDLFVRPRDAGGALHTLGKAGYETDMLFPHWLGKAKLDPDTYIDIIFSSGNAVCEVDDGWFEHGVPGRVLDREALLVPPEEMIWSKSFVMERERYDGADVAHLLLHRIDTLDWDRLRQRFGSHWRLLYAHLTLFGYVYPAHVDRVPKRIMRELSARVLGEYEQPVPDDTLCRGTLLSRAQYLHDVGHGGLSDARLQPGVRMRPEHLARWTAGIAEDA